MNPIDEDAPMTPAPASTQAGAPLATVSLRQGATPMVRLVPMSEPVFAELLPRAIEAYAQENVLSGRWPPAGALARSRHVYETLLPHGVRTPSHAWFEIHDQAHARAGWLWYALDRDQPAPQAHVYEIWIAPEHRRKGIATAAFRLMEKQLKAQGVAGVTLHVFAHNAAARALYVRLGYAVASVNMHKPLD